ncbi:protein CLN8-like [Branchiostoma floridae]|uniref:Protein CLN8-like n=1 Tax=Branchiostoma floridae TaxID=7739 RepID=A0A9J7LN12_BRAFL|nr:protein CLN8-like [Branchiostoma floridae]
MGLVEAIHPSLGTIDYRQPMVKLVFIGGSFLFLSTVFLVGAQGSKWLKPYQNLPLRNKVIWNRRCVRAIFGLFGTVVGSWVIWWDEVANETTPTGFVAVYVALGYFLFDTLVLLSIELMTEKNDILQIGHHCLALLLMSFAAYYECLQYFVVSGLFLEMVMPFDTLCYILAKCGRAKSMIWKVGQAAHIHTYHLRSAVECFTWVQIYRHWNHVWKNTPLPLLFTYLFCLSMVTFVMTPYWGYKETDRLFKSIHNYPIPNQEQENRVQNGDVIHEKDM